MSLDGAAINKVSQGKGGQQTNAVKLANRLIELGYIGLFQQQDENAVESIWNESGVPKALAALTIDPEASALARFLAAEILFYKKETYPPDKQKKQMASVYATALAQNFTGTANTWGLPDVLDGLAGKHFVALGEAAIPQLVTLLHEDGRVYYVGSEEATLGNIYRYRIKDLAAYYISKIMKIRIELDENPSKRDKEIEKLKSAVG